TLSSTGAIGDEVQLPALCRTSSSWGGWTKTKEQPVTGSVATSNATTITPIAFTAARQSLAAMGSKAQMPAVMNRMSTATRNWVQKRAPSKSGATGSMSWVVPRAPAITMGTMIG